MHVASNTCSIFILYVLAKAPSMCHVMRQKKAKSRSLPLLVEALVVGESLGWQDNMPTRTPRAKI
jgi:hypothetical protein